MKEWKNTNNNKKQNISFYRSFTTLCHSFIHKSSRSSLARFTTKFLFIHSFFFAFIFNYKVLTRLTRDKQNIK